MVWFMDVQLDVHQPGHKCHDCRANGRNAALMTKQVKLYHFAFASNKFINLHLTFTNQNCIYSLPNCLLQFCCFQKEEQYKLS